MAFQKVGECQTCKRPIWTDGKLDDKTGTPRNLMSCDCERVSKDKILAPIVIPERDKDLRVRDCMRSDEGHVVAPMRFPLPEPPDPTKRDQVFERTVCIKCESNVILQLVHNTTKMQGLTILTPDGAIYQPA